MKQQHADYQVVPYPKYRRWMVAAFRSTHHKPMIHSLLEVDVTRARWFLRDQKANKEGGSVVYSIPYCLSGESGRRAQSGASFSTRE